MRQSFEGSSNRTHPVILQESRNGSCWARNFLVSYCSGSEGAGSGMLFPRPNTAQLGCRWDFQPQNTKSGGDGPWGKGLSGVCAILPAQPERDSSPVLVTGIKKD